LNERNALSKSEYAFIYQTETNGSGFHHQHVMEIPI